MTFAMNNMRPSRESAAFTAVVTACRHVQHGNTTPLGNNDTDDLCSSEGHMGHYWYARVSAVPIRCRSVPGRLLRSRNIDPSVS